VRHGRKLRPLLWAGTNIRLSFLETEPSKEKRSMSTKISFRNPRRIQSPFKHSTVIKITLFLCLIALTAGWRKSDTLGVAVGIGQQVLPAALDAQKSSADKKAGKAQKLSSSAEKVVGRIQESPEGVFLYVGDYKMNGATPEQIASVIDAIQYPSFSSELEHIPLHKEEFYSGTGYAYLLFKLDSDPERLVYEKKDKEMSAHMVDIDGSSILPSLYVSNDSNYPALSFFFLGDPRDGESKSSCALFGIAQSFPEGTSASDVGLRAKEKFNSNFKIVARDEEVKESIELSPYTYSYSRTILVLTNDSVFVRLISGNSNSFQSTKMDIESYRKVFFNHPNVRMQIYSQTEFGSYDELKKAMDDPKNESIPGFYLLRQLYDGYNKGFEETYAGNDFDERLAAAKAKAGQVILQVYDQKLIAHYLVYKTELDRAQQEAQQAAEEKAKAEEAAKKKAALEF